MNEMVKVESLSALAEVDRQELSEMRVSFDKYGGVPMGMSEFQIKYGVLSSREFPTTDSKYWQAMREIQTRYHSLIDLQYQFNKLQLETEMLKVDYKALNGAWIVGPKTQIKKELLRNDIAYGLLRLDGMKTNMNDTVRQMKIFWAEAKKWEKEKKHGTKEEAEEEFWTELTTSRNRNIVPIKGIIKE